jgi:hypothetical protein
MVKLYKVCGENLCRVPIDKNSGRISRARLASIYRFKVLKSPKQPKTPTAFAEGVLGKRGGKQV